MVAPLIATDYLVVNPQQIITIGTVMPPPPIPATFARPTSAGKMRKPKNSGKYIGKIPLCVHIF